MSKIKQTNENSSYPNEYVWRLQDKVKALESRIEALEKALKEAVSMLNSPGKYSIEAFNNDY